MNKYKSIGLSLLIMGLTVIISPIIIVYLFQLTPIGDERVYYTFSSMDEAELSM
jgi:hypothetical protein